MDDRDAINETGQAGSRLAVILSGAAAGLASELESRFERVAARTWDCDERAVDYSGGTVTHIDTNETLTLADLAAAIGAMTRHRRIAESDLLQERLPVFPESAADIAGPAVRNRGTLGGNLAEADPVGNDPVVTTALGASVTLRSAPSTADVTCLPGSSSSGRRRPTSGTTNSSKGASCRLRSFPRPGRGWRSTR
ncbi:hypothetical protein BRC81_00270 [Halobacteriales archaeon QS_1_68_20]|nr:MAG: hypothetical protein BRC81_00270 [Halobacteriales archaeon QS_1_68_20]